MFSMPWCMVDFAMGGTRDNERQRETTRGGAQTRAKHLVGATRGKGNKGGQTAKTLLVHSNQ
jgi:hypothetical protein